MDEFFKYLYVELKIQRKVLDQRFTLHTKCWDQKSRFCGISMDTTHYLYQYGVMCKFMFDNLPSVARTYGVYNSDLHSTTFVEFLN